MTEITEDYLALTKASCSSDPSKYVVQTYHCFSDPLKGNQIIETFERALECKKSWDILWQRGEIQLAKEVVELRELQKKIEELIKNNTTGFLMLADIQQLLKPQEQKP